MKREFQVEVLGTLLVGGKPMQLSRRVTSKGVKCYLHYPCYKVTKDNEISKDLCLSILNNMEKW
jgi:hypothetical protein